MLTTILFWLFSAGIIISSVGVIRARSAAYSVLLLVVAMGLTAGLFALLGAYFLAVIQVLVYAGAILVLFLFIVMLLDIKELTAPGGGFRPSVIAALAAAVAFLALGLGVVRAVGPVGKTSGAAGNARELGELIFSKYALPFELTSILILGAVLSIVVLAKREAK